MKAVSEYRQHASECRKIARGMPDGDARQQLLLMAETWERLAQDVESRSRIASDEGSEVRQDEPNSN